MSALLRTEEKEIDGVLFTVRVLNVAMGREALVKLQRLLGPAIGELVDGGVRGGAARALAGLSQNLSNEDLKWFCDKLGANTTVKQYDAEGRERVVSLEKPAQQDELFAGRMLLMIQWLEFALEVNFADVLGKVRASLANASEQGKAAPKSA